MTNQEIAKQIHKEYPDVYRVIGVGWCGPDYEAATKREIELRIYGKAAIHVTPLTR